MNITDKKVFGELMINCFQNFRANISKGMIEEWFDELESFPIENIKKAFSRYCNEVEDYPPKRATIIRFVKIQFEVDRNESSPKSCVRMIEGKICGNEIFTLQYCEQCWTDVRPKTDVDIKIDEFTKKLREQQERDGCKTEEDRLQWHRKNLGLTTVGQILLKNMGKDESQNDRSGVIKI